MTRHLIALLFLLTSALMLSACYSVPYTGRSQFTLISESTEMSSGEEAWATYKPTVKESKNAAFVSAVKRVATALTQQADRPEYKWEFMAVETKDVNAFCMPGGKIAVYEGIYSIMDNDAELACVVAHEIAHALARHSAGQQSQSILVTLGAGIVALFDDSGLATTAYVGAAQLGVMLPYSREQEYEADYIGCILMSKAGYDPHYAVLLWEKMSQLSGDGTVFENFLSTHPINSKRIEAMTKNMDEFNSFYAQSAKKGAGTLYKNNR